MQYEAMYAPYRQSNFSHKQCIILYPKIVRITVFHSNSPSQDKTPIEILIRVVNRVYRVAVSMDHADAGRMSPNDSLLRNTEPNRLRMSSSAPLLFYHYEITKPRFR